MVDWDKIHEFQGRYPTKMHKVGALSRMTDEQIDELIEAAPSVFGKIFYSSMKSGKREDNPLYLEYLDCVENGGSMVKIIKCDITRVAADAIVNAANEGLAAGGGVCGAIFRTAGYEDLQRACDAIGHCNTGDAVITPGFGLRAKFVIHAVGPVWRGGRCGEAGLLIRCYEKAIDLAVENGCESIAFPLISSGIYGYPKEGAWRVALGACLEKACQLGDLAPEIIFCVLDDASLELGLSMLEELTASPR